MPYSLLCVCVFELKNLANRWIVKLLISLEDWKVFNYFDLQLFLQEQPSLRHDMNWKTWGMFARDHAPEGNILVYFIKGSAVVALYLDKLQFFLAISVNSQHTAENSTTLIFSSFTQTDF